MKFLNIRGITCDDWKIKVKNDHFAAYFLRILLYNDVINIYVIITDPAPMLRKAKHCMY